MDKDNEIEEITRHEFFWETALKDPERRKGACGFLEIMIAFTVVACLIVSSFIAFPTLREAVNPKLFKALVVETGLFIMHLLSLGYCLSGVRVNKKANSRVMTLILILDLAVWIMFALAFIVLSMFSH